MQYHPDSCNLVMWYVRFPVCSVAYMKLVKLVKAMKILKV
ncbi:unnamed protein product [Brugia pahangi]|uniref:Uncharacterized protein n=1 Tax=Brugia pahangi TaxID=6280 RepID=A0A0N4TG50_BRUPA|nr:unnamed protein product [Brugia pahangi]